MIAYNNLWLNNNLAVNELDAALAANLITKNEFEASVPLYSVKFYSPHLFVRMGLFILTTVVVIFSLGLFSLLFLSALNQDGAGTLFIFFGLICYALLEWLVASRHHYQSGVDDALLWLCATFIVTGVNVNGDIIAIKNVVLIFSLSAWFTVRFTDRLMLIVASIAMFAFVFFLQNKMGTYTRAFIPFSLMLTAVLLYFIFRALGSFQKLYLYRKCCTVGIITCLLCFYIAGNYFVVREVSNSLYNVQLKAEESIPFAWFIWMVTVITPLLYIMWGILKKDIIFIRTGLILVAATVFTIRYYYQNSPIEMIMIIGGVLLIAVAYLLTLLLKFNRAGFTAQPLISRYNDGIENIESIIIAETMSSTAGEDSGSFEGGDFGGGGASEDY